MARNVISSHVNSQGELITFEKGELYGEPVDLLCIHDDPPPSGTGTRAPMLLDDSTREWLRGIAGPEESSDA